MIFFLGVQVFAQDSTSTKVRDQLEEVFEEVDLEDGQAGEQLIQFLQELENNPVDINSADVTKLLQIPGISFVLARSIIVHREDQPFKSVEDILKVPGIGEATFHRIAPYITVENTRDQFRALYFDPGFWFTNSKIEVISRYQQTLEEQSGFTIPDSLGGYSGNPMKYYQRFKLRSNHFTFNLTQEKDAGEELNDPTDFDFNSIHVGITDVGKLKKFVVGDFSLSFGQGLVIWTGGAFGKGRDVINSIGRNERGLRPYTSAQESNFFRGAAVTYGSKNEFTFFYSNLPQSASVVGVDSVRFPSSSGFHRTLNEINRRNNVDQTTIGGRFRLDSKLGLFGLSTYSTSFNSVIIHGNSLSNRYDFEGRSNSVIGFDYRALIGASLVIGEFARSENNAFAGLIGIESKIGNETDLSILYRNYSTKFISVLGDGFGESSGFPQNERGLYIGLKHHISKYTISTYFDQYFFDAPIGSINTPSSGVDILGMIEAKISSTLIGYLLIRSETKDDVFESISESGRVEEILGSRTRSSYRLQVQHQPTKSFRSRSRVEWVRFNSADQEGENGFLVYQDARIQLANKILLDVRFTLFDTETFNTRVYQFENDLRYVLSNVALSDRGQRWYFVIKYDITKSLEISTKISRTVIEDAQILSSGLNEIEGNTRTFVGAQVRWSL